jgi:glycosyltransferase involved in cell wall biosynthesis
MRFGAIYEPGLSAANYRAIFPLLALARRGHDIEIPPTVEGWLEPAAMFGCDAVIFYRRLDRRAKQLLGQLQERGIGVVYDNDDDFRHTPRENRSYKSQRERDLTWSLSVDMAKRADAATATTAALAARYAESGAPEPTVIPNLLPGGKLRRKPRRHDGFVIGWIAGHEHAPDARALGIPEALAELQAQRPDVHVECVGVDLGLDTRYRHAEELGFDDLVPTMAGWDLAIAPLADTVFNATRSDIKVKEYAASQLPWLASPYGPYADLGEHQGGRLVPDGQWLAALTAIVDDKRARKRLAKAGEKWAKTQTTDAVAGEWEAVLTEAARRAQARTQARARVPA